MSKADAVRKSLDPCFEPYRLPSVLVDGLAHTLQRRGLSQEKFLEATANLMARLLEAWNFHGMKGFPLRLGTFALVNLVVPSAEIMAEDGSFCFCVGIGAPGTLSLKFSAKGEVHSSTIDEADYTKIWSTAFYQRLRKQSGNYSGPLLTKAVLYDLENCVHVYMSVDDVIWESTTSAPVRSASIPSSAGRPCAEKVDRHGTAPGSRDKSRSRSSSLDADFVKRRSRDVDEEDEKKIMDLCVRLSRLLRKDTSEQNNWKHLALNLLGWDFSASTLFEKENRENSPDQMLAEFINREKAHQLHNKAWIHHRIVKALISIGRRDLLRALKIQTPCSTPTEEHTPDLRSYPSEPSTAPQSCSEASSKDDVLLASGKTPQPMNSLAEDIHASLKVNHPKKEDEPSSEQNFLIKSTMFNLKDLRLVKSADEGYEGQAVPLEELRCYRPTDPPKQHCPPNTTTQSFPGHRSSDKLPQSADTDMHISGIPHSANDSLGSGSGYPNPDEAVQRLGKLDAQQGLPSAGERNQDGSSYPCPDDAIRVAARASEEAVNQADRDCAGSPYPPPKDAVQAAVNASDHT